MDSDVILDVATARPTFYQDSAMVLAMIENGQYQGFTSSNCIANVYYILRSKGGDAKAREFIRKLIQFVKILPITQMDIMSALDSSFSDFEDSLQHESAKNHACDVIITRNLADYKHASVAVFSPTQFLQRLNNQG